MIHLTTDYSTLSDYRRCPRLTAYKLVANRVPAEPSDALAFGTAIHAALAVWHSAAGKIIPLTDAECRRAAETTTDRFIRTHSLCLRCDALEAFTESAADTSLINLTPDTPRSIRHGLTLLLAYFTHWGDPLTYFNPETDPDGQPTLELEFRSRLTNQITYSGRIDGIVRDRDGNLLILEHKTSFYLGSSFFNRAKPNDQISGYIYLAREAGYPVIGAIINGLQTATGKLLKSPGDCFARHTTFRTDEEIEDWKARAIKDADRLIQDVKTNHFSANAPDACTVWNTVCPFADVCNAPAAQRSAILERAYAVGTWPMAKIEIIPDDIMQYELFPKEIRNAALITAA